MVTLSFCLLYILIQNFLEGRWIFNAFGNFLENVDSKTAFLGARCPWKIVLITFWKILVSVRQKWVLPKVPRGDPLGWQGFSINGGVFGRGFLWILEKYYDFQKTFKKLLFNCNVFLFHFCLLQLLCWEDFIFLAKQPVILAWLCSAVQI